MDLTPYYEYYMTTYKWGVIAVIFSFIAVVFCIVSTVRDKSEECRPVWKKVVYSLGYLLIHVFVFCWSLSGGLYQMKQDVNEGTICGFEGEFEIVEVISGFRKEAVFRINGEEITLRYYDEKDDWYDAELIQPGKYMGKLVYGEHTAKVICAEIYPLDGEAQAP